MTLFPCLEKFHGYHRYLIFFICIMTLSALVYIFIIINKTERRLHRSFSEGRRELSDNDTGTITIQYTTFITIQINVIHRKCKNGIR